MNELRKQNSSYHNDGCALYDKIVLKTKSNAEKNYFFFPVEQSCEEQSIFSSNNNLILLYTYRVQSKMLLSQVQTTKDPTVEVNCFLDCKPLVLHKA